MDRDEVEVHKYAKGSISSHLDGTSSANKQLFYGKRTPFSCGTRRVFPNGQDSAILPAWVANQRRIRFLLLAHGACNIIVFVTPVMCVVTQRFSPVTAAKTKKSRELPELTINLFLFTRILCGNRRRHDVSSYILNCLTSKDSSPLMTKALQTRDNRLTIT